jgi:uncharacterized protein YggE
MENQMRIILNSCAIIAALLLAAQTLAAQVMGNAAYNQSVQAREPGSTFFINDSTMMLQVDALMNVKADSYVAILGLSQIGTTLDSVNLMLNDRINGFVNDLGRLGIDRKDIYVDMISQVPTYDYEVKTRMFSRTYTEVPTGFDLKKNVHISFTRADQLDEILLEAARHEIYDLVKVDYVVDDTEKIYDSLREAAVRIVQKKIAAMEKLGVKFAGMYQTVSESTSSVFPIERYTQYAAYSTTTLREVKKSLLGSTTVQEARKPITAYYNHAPHNGYDIVINPNVVEPMVQYSYSLALRWVLKKG